MYSSARRENLAGALRAASDFSPHALIPATSVHGPGCCLKDLEHFFTTQTALPVWTQWLNCSMSQGELFEISDDVWWSAHEKERGYTSRKRLENDLEMLMKGGDHPLEPFGERLTELICYELCLRALTVKPDVVTHLAEGPPFLPEGSNCYIQVPYDTCRSITNAEYMSLLCTLVPEAFGEFIKRWVTPSYVEEIYFKKGFVGSDVTNRN
eukprot:6474703-Amphidinium_carterae.1